MPLNCTLKMVKVINFVLYIYHNKNVNIYNIKYINIGMCVNIYNINIYNTVLGTVKLERV